MSERLFPATLLLATLIVFWKAQTKGQAIGFPRPYRFVGVAMTWTVLALLATVQPQLAAAFGVGFDVILALRKGTPDPSIKASGTATGANAEGVHNLTTVNPIADATPGVLGIFGDALGQAGGVFQGTIQAVQGAAGAAAASNTKRAVAPPKNAIPQQP